MLIVKITTLFLSIMLVGCASTVKKGTGSDTPLNFDTASKSKIFLIVKGSKIASDSGDWELLRAEWRTAMGSSASLYRIPYKYQDVSDFDTSESGTLVIVNVNDYRYISSGARYAVGAAIGNAYMDVDVSFIGLPNRKTIGTRKYSTSSSFFQGVLAPMTAEQIQSICNEIVREILKR